LPDNVTLLQGPTLHGSWRILGALTDSLRRLAALRITTSITRVSIKDIGQKGGERADFLESSDCFVS
jgi:hypothetical protein